ncbi:MAG: sulfur carrier protein ThiS adenylyltransferase ThiF [Victivallales bacterium]|nr:sulfur carrier protein ThiS adenylyltransferase ThiF [Victivallales bacterium]
MFEEIFESNPPDLTDAMRASHFLLFGAGGLGSNAAMMLARAGAGKLTIVDFDLIVPQNLNRQHYYLDQVGMRKVDALRDNLLRVNPEMTVVTVDCKVTAENVGNFRAIDADVVLECFDNAESKTLLVSDFIKNRPKTPIVAVSGLAGIGLLKNLTMRAGPGKLLLIGDGESETTPESGTLSTRVIAAAAMQAHEAIRLVFL